MPADFAILRKFLEPANRLALLTHEKPDGDAIGSCIAMAVLLGKLGKNATPCLIGPCPHPYRFLTDQINCLDILDQPIRPGTDALLVLDTGTWNQLGAGGSWLKNQDLPRMIVDHHRTQDDLGGPALVDTTAEATAVLVFQAYGHFGIKPDPLAANALFTALAFDTGWFRHSNVTPHTFRMAGELVDLGAQPTHIYNQVHQQEPLRRMQLRGKALSSLKLFHSGKVGLLRLGLNDFQDSGCTLADSEGLSDLPRQISGVEIAIALFEEAPGKVRVSLRSSGAGDVGKIAEAFSGGGHKAAAGCRLEMDLGLAEKTMLQAVQDQVGE
ncbi:MAG: bifunctional oligoribonuclease/PAP phosphatase NrnA [Gemmataceae bacterium]|jgi:phosphoesterase RecJ-like protein|nr:bifunctional oligoribonuclease/PAP phosphatase NrnA [Gemmataceae bacterium]